MSEGANPKVSVITATYNHERYIGACIDSVLAQTYSNWEQIIIDDGSTDRTAEVVSRYQDERIRLFTQPNSGIENLAHTCNRALRHAKGSLIAILEGDDLWPANKLTTMVPFFHNQEDLVLAFGGCQDIDATGKLNTRALRSYRQRSELPRAILFNDPVGSATPYLLSARGQLLITTSTVLIRRSALESIGGFQYFPGKCPTDVPTFVKLSRAGRFHYAAGSLGYRRRHLNSATLVYLDVMPATALRFVMSSVEELGSQLSESDRKMIERSWERVPPGLEFSKGRMALVNGQWKEARSHFAHALNHSEARVFLAASIGWLGSLFHFNLEFLFRLAGRSTLEAE